MDDAGGFLGWAFERFALAFFGAVMVTLVIFALVPMMIADSTQIHAEDTIFAIRVREVKPPPPPEDTLPPPEPEKMPPPPDPEVKLPVLSTLQVSQPRTDMPLFRPDVRLSAMSGPALSVPRGEPGPGIQGFEIGDVDQGPRAVVRSPPIYPFRARSMGIEGVVKVRFLVDVTGRAQHITILEATPAGVFENAVIQAVKSWRFEAATLEGRKVATWVVAPLRFNLGED